MEEITETSGLDPATRCNILDQTENHGVPGSNPGSATTTNCLSIGYTSLVTSRGGAFCASECRCVRPGGCQRSCQRSRRAFPEPRQEVAPQVAVGRGIGAAASPLLQILVYYATLVVPTEKQSEKGVLRGGSVSYRA